MKYRGKVTNVGRRYLTVVLYSKSEEVVGEVDKNLFPKNGYKVGQIFDYSVSTSRNKVSVTYELVKEEIPSKADLDRLRKSIHRQLKGIEDI